MSEKGAGTQVSLLGIEAALAASSAALLYVVISRLVGPTLLGEYSLVLAWVYLASAFGSFGIPEFVLREMGRLPEHPGKLLANGARIGVLCSSAVSLVMVGLAQLPGYEAKLETALLLGALTVCPKFILEICRSAFIGLGRADTVVLITFVESAAVVSSSIFLVMHGYGLRELIIALVAAKAFACLLALVLFRAKFRDFVFETDREYSIALLSPLFTFWLSRVLGIFSERLNIIMLSFWVSPAVVGLYAGATKIMELLLIVPNVFAQVLLSKIAGTLAKQTVPDLRSYYLAFTFLFSLTCVLGVGVIVFADQLLTLLFGEKFEASVIILRLLMIFYMVEVLDAMLSVIYKASGKERQDLRYYSVHPITNVLVNIALIPVAGGAGAAIGRMSAGLCSTAIRYANQSIVVPWWRFISLPLGVSLAGAMISTVIAPSMHWLIAAAIYGVLTIGALWLAYVRVHPRPGDR